MVNNDFTKEELVKLKLAIMILYDKDGLIDTKRIAYKIQSMIDNYDDQAPKLEIRTVTCCKTKWNYFNGDKGIARCHICNKVF